MTLCQLKASKRANPRRAKRTLLSMGAKLVGPLLLVACSTSPPNAKLGVFYGGELQELNRLPYSPEPGRERYGFEVALPKPAERPLRVSWEVRRPVKNRGQDQAPVEVDEGHEELLAGDRTLRKVFSFAPGAPLGTWNFRVLVERQLVLDRSVDLYDASSR